MVSKHGYSGFIFIATKKTQPYFCLSTPTSKTIVTYLILQRTHTGNTIVPTFSKTVSMPLNRVIQKKIYPFPFSNRPAILSISCCHRVIERRPESISRNNARHRPAGGSIAYCLRALAYDVIEGYGDERGYSVFIL